MADKLPKVGDGSVPEWQTTRLWTELDNREDELAKDLSRYVAGVLPKIEKVLAKGDSTPGTFTLHDSEHSFRVAERIVDLAGEELAGHMDPYDLGLLLLSAYLHDIGMTPPVARIDAIWAYLLSGAAQELPDGEQEAIQAWLDDEAHGIAAPLSEGQPTIAILQQARSLIAEYVRFCHNDWSANWIEENLTDLDDHTYSGCQSDLIRLCKSHHYGFDELRSDDFQPRYVGNPGTVLHLRFDACLLRVADVLDFDPERTPKILYTHRDVEDSSAIFWHQDHELAFKLDGSHIAIHARPPSALLHHAIDLTVADVNRELQLCQRLANETQFHRMPDRAEDLPHRWSIDVSVVPNVKPRDDSYEYMDGTFRPDQERILDLLGGIALYGSPLAAVRELLQNAFDAVREQIAYQRLRHPAPASAEAHDSIAAMHEVSLVLEQTDQGMRLVCRDTGIGMSQDIVKSRFLVSGSTASHETKALERACEEKGFSVGRTARFGIGVLAYFLLGAHLKIETRRSSDAGDPEETGWTFVSDGLSDFGELRRNDECQPGTQVELTIRSDAMPNGPEEFARAMDAYVRNTIRRVPCNFSFTARGVDIEPFVSGPGWVDRSVDIERSFLEPMLAPGDQIEQARTDLYSSGRLRAFEQRRQRWEKLSEHAAEVLSVKEEQGELPDGLGSYRILVGYFTIQGQVLLTYLDVSESDEGGLQLSPIEGIPAIELGGGTQASWNGMSVAVDMGRHRAGLGRVRPGTLVEIDLTSDLAGELAVDRNTVTADEGALAGIRFVRERAWKLQSKLVRENGDSPFALINGHVAQVAVETEQPLMWPENEGDFGAEANKPTRLSPLVLPAIDMDRYEVHDLSGVCWRGKRVAAVPTMSIGAAGNRKGSWTWHGSLFAPQMVGAREGHGLMQPFPLWTRVEASSSQGGPPGFAGEFPPQWSTLVGIEAESLGAGETTRIWNPAHPVVAAVDTASWEWVGRTFPRDQDPLPHAGALMQSRSRIAAWILISLEYGNGVIWAGLTERSPDFLPDAWRLLGLDGDELIVDWREEYGETILRLLGPSSWESLDEPEAGKTFAEIMDDPGDDWWLTGDDGNRQLPTIRAVS